MAEHQMWGRVSVVGPDRSVIGTRILEGRGLPSLAAVDDVARLQLCAARLGGGIFLDSVTQALRELLDLAGLSVEMRGEAEEGEYRLGVQEHVEPGDPAV
jgi:hypothetical protein